MVNEQTPSSKYFKKHTGVKNILPQKSIPIILAVLILAGVVLLLCTMRSPSAYRQIVRMGYAGTQEQWLASLVGEEADTGDADSAYELAVQNGYKGSETEWNKTLIGVETDGRKGSLYTLACENGFEGSLSEWLTELAHKPDRLGRSEEGSPKTEYELACEYGYSGTFIEWLVSVTHDRVFEQEENT